MQLRMVLTQEKIESNVLLPVPEGFTMRTFQPGDEKPYIELMLRSGFACWNEEFRKKEMASLLPGGLFFIVEKSTGRLAATTMANTRTTDAEGTFGEFGWVAVDPDFRGKHLARITGAAVIDFFRKRGFKKIYLYTDDHRSAALVTYLKTGWLPILKGEADYPERWQKVCRNLNLPMPDTPY